MAQDANNHWKDKILTLLKEEGIVRPRDVEKYGIPREYVRRLYKKGVIERVGRGLYALPGTLTSESQQFAEISKRVPKGVICLLSALQYHNLTTQLPHEVWLAIQSPGWRPKLDYPPIRVVWMSQRPYEHGIELHNIDGVSVRIYSIEKTIADCFKFRNKIGIDVAIEALREAGRKRAVSMDKIWKAAKVCRVTGIIRPYMEAVV